MDKPHNIIFDTDIGFDCDDAGALALLHRLCDKGEARLLAVTACYDSPYVAGCIDAINTYYGRPVPVGVLYGTQKAVDSLPVYSPSLCREFPNRYPENKYPGTEDAVSVLRKTLFQAEDNSVTLVVTGSLATAAALVKSKPDSACPLSGKALIAQKICRTVVMGGRFFETWPMDIFAGQDHRVTWEWNIKADVKAAQTVCEFWPGELIFSSYEIGLWCVSMKDYCQSAPENDPVRRAYQLHGSTNGRSSWDHTAILEAVRPGQYYHLHPWGRITVDDNGITSWQDDHNGKQTYLIPKVDYTVVKNIIDALALPS